jgi:hypothetical protein
VPPQQRQTCAQVSPPWPANMCTGFTTSSTVLDAQQCSMSSASNRVQWHPLVLLGCSMHLLGRSVDWHILSVHMACMNSFV